MKKHVIIAMSVLVSASTIAQEKPAALDNWYQKNKEALGQFETKKDTATTFDGVKVKLGGSFALQYQALDHSNTADTVLQGGVNINQLYNIGSNFNLATANMDFDVALDDGINMHLRTYLSSRHHPEPYVKGGYIQIDKLDIIKKDFLKGIMDYATIKIGHDDINYGDAHFRRSDNAGAIVNPFVGNLLMDQYATFIFGEAYLKYNGFLAMVGITNAKLNQTASRGTKGASYFKLGYDKQLSDDFRVRLTGSYYYSEQTKRSDFYTGDRTGSRYYFVMENSTASSSAQAQSGRINPGFETQLTAFMINPFIKWKGLEFFGVAEYAEGKDGGRFMTELSKRSYRQFSAELLYRFGNDENFYIGGRYNVVNGRTPTNAHVDILRYNVGAGWFLNKSILVKAEYVNQEYNGYDKSSIFNGGKFNGIVAEAIIAF